MSAPIGRRPIPRRRVLAAAAGIVALFAAVIAAGELLRHPVEPRPTVSADDFMASDPRDELLCPDPAPREGQERQEDTEQAMPVEVDSGALLDCPQTFDGRAVIYRGEVVGALLDREAGVWTQLNDDVYAELVGPLPAHRFYQGLNAGIGVLLPHEAAAQVEAVGGPQTRGDVLEIRGTFHRVDPTGEVAVIRADAAEVVGRGERTVDPPLANRRVAAWVAMLIGIGLVIAERVIAARR